MAPKSRTSSPINPKIIWIAVVIAALIAVSGYTTTALSSWASSPTLPGEQAQEEIRELFETNGDCQLPCWWGITLGRSTNTELYNLVQGIAIPNMFWRTHQGASDTIEFYSELPRDMQYWGESVLHGRVYASHGIVTRIYLEDFEWRSYHLAPFLLENGKPDEIWISTYRSCDQASNVPFTVYLLYSEKGMLVSYEGSGTQQDEKIVGCVNSSPALSMWVPTRKLSFAEAYSLTGNDFYQAKSKLISETTEGGMDAEQFYEQFKGSDDIPCVETHANLWPITK